MPRSYGMYKPGERSPADGTFYCYVCSLRGEVSRCDRRAGELFVECPACLERKVPEWDMVWKAETHPTARDRTSWWPGSLARKG